MAEAGLLHRSVDLRWVWTIVSPTECGAWIAGTGLSAPRPPGERLLHRLAVADAGIRLCTPRSRGSRSRSPARSFEDLPVFSPCEQPARWPDRSAGSPTASQNYGARPRSASSGSKFRIFWAAWS